MEIVEPWFLEECDAEGRRSATINLYFKHVTCSQDTLKMASSTQTKKIHVPMVSIVRNSLKFWLGLKSLWLKPVTDEITPVSLLIH